jgi:anaerobic magnesium-protoporphyrin IX monomethyl ester cyclase
VVQEGLDVDFYLPNGMTVINLTKDIASTMAAAGFKRLFFGLETTDPARLRKIKKGFTSADKVEAGATWFAEHGVAASASLIIGLPGQTLAEIAYDSVNMMSRHVQFMTNPFYPIPGSQDFERCVGLGLISRETEPALFDMFNFSIGSDVLSPDELYWSWVATQAVVIWPEFIAKGHLDRRHGRRIAPVVAVDELVQHSRAISHDHQLKRAVSPVEAAGLLVRMDEDGCFCSTQRLRERVSAGGPPDACAFPRDVIASAISLYTGSAYSAAQRSSSLAATGERCSFEVHPTTSSLRERILREFENALTELIKEQPGTFAEARATQPTRQ